MFGVTDVGLFIISGLMLNLIPGPDSLYVISDIPVILQDACFQSA